MTDAELNAIRERCNAATAGPWTFYLVGNEDDSAIRDYTVVCANDGGGWDVLPGMFRKEFTSDDDFDEFCRNYRFTAHARTDIPALLTEIDRLRSIVAAGVARVKPKNDNAATLAAIMGKWPGDETDEQIEQALKELS